MTKKIQARHERKQKGIHDLVPDLFDRNRISNKVRRRLNIGQKEVDAKAILEEEKRKEAKKIEEKEKNAQENAHDLEMLAAIVNSSYVNGGPTPATEVPPAAGSSNAGKLPAEELGRGTGDGLLNRDTSHATTTARESTGNLPPLTARPISSGVNDDDGDSSDDDNEDNA